MTPIPDPLPHPPDDSGAGAWGSQPIYSRADDLAFAQVAAAAVVAADSRGWTHAARFLNHYLDNTGDPLDPKVDELLRDVSDADNNANRMAATEIQQVAIRASSAKNYDNPVQFQSQWEGYTFDQTQSPDWFFAMGSIHMSVTGVVTVNKPADGAQPNITTEYKVWVHDRYNWDGGKSTEIAGVTVTDKRMGALHTAGLAREYEMDGSSGARQYAGPVPSSGPGILPAAHGSRDGGRTDPTR
ncbi:hypothetical protein K7711_25895 [Nocardia sp. CA2R105]|uniref:hypothetical protein n=1 Tax=Nocardia coffeae TaxID=2873381 RepID=UPI001CA68F50|nr:hypothetical protein [Nocardia coffeae]MBY8859928.1 hypothetical protein [Nocardia coffeae]